MAPAGSAARVVHASAGRIVVNLLQSADDLIDTYSSGAKLYLDSSTTEDGSYSAVTNTALVSGQEQYELEDLTGTTSTWYKARVGNTGGTTYSDHGPALQATALLSYASLWDVLPTMQLGTATGHHALLSDLLADVTADVDTMTGRTFTRVPQVTGTETFYLDVRMAGQRSLSIAAGDHCTDGRALDIVSVTSLYVRDSESGDYVEITAGDTGYLLRPGYGPGVAGTDWPYEDVLLSPAGSRTYWPLGLAAVKVIGVRGFPKVPGMVKRAVISEVRERFRQSIGGGPTQAGINQFGTPIYVTGSTQEFRMLGKHPYRKGFGVA
jgi:hypothetical protein